MKAGVESTNPHSIRKLADDHTLRIMSNYLSTSRTMNMNWKTCSERCLSNSQTSLF